MPLAELTAKIAKLNRQMESELAERVQVFEGADLATIRREAHKLRGGFPHRKRLTSLAAQVEELAVAGDEAAARRAVLTLCEEAQRISVASTEPASTEAVPKTGVGVSPGRPLRILVVDDDHAIRRFSVTSLARLGGHTLSQADSADGVVEQAREGLYDLIIADGMMPGVGGVELALTLREQGIKVPVVVLSAAAPEELGAVDAGLAWWRKPISPQELVRRVAELMSEDSAPTDRF